MKSGRAWSDIGSLTDARAHGLREAEFAHLRKVLDRELSILEIGICAALCSEHCSYKSTKKYLKTLPTTGKRVIHGPGENAGVVDIGENQAVVFKIESHNHPSFIEPYQGAATGVGGILRDVFTMGARPVALMNALRFGAPDNARTPYLLNRAVAGIGNYGNCVGVPTVGGELFFHPAYNGNCLVNACAVGVADQDGIFLGKASGVGNSVVYLGSKTGRDGIHGATMSSESFGSDSESKRPTVQVGDPFQEKLLIEACLELMKSDAVVGIQDMGAAGLTCSAYEMAERAGNGVRLELDKVPQRASGMTPYEIMLSESQERMLLVVEAGREHEVIAIATRWELDAVAIGEVIEGGNVELWWNGKLVSSMPAEALTRAVLPLDWPVEAPSTAFPAARDILANARPRSNLAEIWLGFLGSPNICSRFPLYSQYDSTVRGDTANHPGGDSGVIRIKSRRPNQVERGLAMTVDCNSRYCAVDPYLGTAHSLAEACRNLSASGAEPIAISDCLNFGSPENPGSMWQIVESVRGLADAARAFGVPIVSGNVSLYNQTEGTAVLPTPMLAVVGLMPDVRRAVGSDFLNDGDVILVVGYQDDRELGGSEYVGYRGGDLSAPLPVLDFEREARVAAFVRRLVSSGEILSARDISIGGLGVALVECCVSPYSMRGATLRPIGPVEIPDGYLFGESGTRFILSCRSADRDKLVQEIQAENVPLIGIGVVGGAKIAIEGLAEIPLSAAAKSWRHGLAGLFG